MKKRIFLAIGLLVPVVAAWGEPIDPNNPPHGLFADEWQIVYLAGQKVGYSHVSMARVKDRIITKSSTLIRIGRMDQPVELMMSEQATETISGKPISFENVQALAKMKTVTRGTIVDGRLTIKTVQFGIEREQELDFPAGAIFKTWGAFRESLLRGFKPGLEYSLKVYEPTFRQDGTITALTKVGGFEEIEFEGKPRRAQRVDVIMETPIGSLSMVSWIDSDGWPIKSTVPLPGIGNMELVRADRAAALADFVAPELFLNTTIKANRSIDVERARRITYRITAADNETDLSDLPTTGMQRVVKSTRKSVELVVTRLPRSGKGGDTGGSSKPPAAEYLDSNLMINTADPELVALARRAGGGETDPHKLSDKLRRFVTDYIVTKSLDIGFATASEVCRNREGDCSEHGVLLAALGRLNGLPSRVVVGLVYVPSLGSQRDIFGYHMWTQFFIDGGWVDVDAAMRETDVSPAHIAFAASSMKNSGLFDLSFALITKMGGISIEILEIVPNDGP